ncbi:uncharacterized protein LOC111322968 [Stylophora pistillata]|nr:uncharacterized protein LOC111322968 [Stylophora pistillata]
MADRYHELDARTNLSPRIIFVRLGKDKSKDTVEDEIFKYIKKVLNESTVGNSDLEKAKSCVTLPDFGTGKIVQVAVGPAFIGFLFHDGRVCRMKCVSRNSESTQTLNNSQDYSEEPIFQVKSDEVYAKQLQNQLNEEIRTKRTSPGRSLVHGGATSSLNLSFRASDGYDSGDVLLSDRTRQSVVKPWSAKAGPSSSADDGTTQVNQETQTGREDLQQTNNTPGNGGSSSHETNKDKSKQSCNTDENVNPDESCTVGDDSVTSDFTNQENKETAGTSKPNVQDKCSQEVENSSGNVSINNSSSGASSRSSNSRRSVSRPTFLHRTLYAANLPGVVRPWPPYGIPVVGSVQQFPPYISRGNRTSGRSSVPLQAHVVRAHLAEQLAGAYVFSRGPRGPRRTNFQRKDERATGENSETTSCSDADFCYPEIGDLEWLEVENGQEVAFSHITAMHSEFVLVEKGTGILYHWPYESDVACDVAMEISSSLEPSYFPLAKPHPLGEALGLDSEEVCLLASSNVRCSLVTSSGKICTFYDKLLRESNCGDPPALVQELSHSARAFAELQGEEIVSISCSEFFSGLMTQSGKIFWWGLLPAEERQNFRQKLSKATNQSSNIGVNEKVQLRQHFPGFPGALVYKYCEVRGPIVGRLIGHESPEGTSTVVTKIKVEPLYKRSASSDKPESGIVQTDIDISAANSSRAKTVEEEFISSQKDFARSSSPHTSVRRKAQFSHVSSNGSEIWEVKDVVFLESENKLLGTVAAIDGPHVIVKVANVMSPSESSLRVFKLSELEPVPSEGAEGSTLTRSLSTSSLYRGCIQHAPKCVVSSSPRSVGKDVLSGFRPVAMTATSTGISLIVQRLSDKKAFFMGPAMEQVVDSSKVYTCSGDVNVTSSIDDGSCTVEAEAIQSQEGALEPVSLVPSDTSPKPIIGLKRRRRSDENDDDVDSDTLHSTQTTPNIESSILNRLLPCNFHSANQKFPLLHSSSDYDIVLLTDVNGCLCPRPFGTKLSSPNVGDIPPVQSFGLGTRLGHSSAENSSPERVLIAFIAFQEQHLIQAVQSGVVERIQEALNFLKQLNNSKDIGKVNKSMVKGSKKVAIADTNGQVHGEPAGQTIVINKRVLQLLHQHTTSNQNLLHICCSNPTFTENRDWFNNILKKCSKGTEATLPTEGDSESREEMPEDVKGSESREELPTEVRGLHILLNDSVFAKEFVPMLRGRDACGNTPFMTAIQCHNFKAAVYILDFVEKNKENCSLKEMIFPGVFNGMTPLHALAVACTENLSPSGLGNSLTVTNLPSSYTPRILLKLFQSRYPSVYRATIPPMDMEGRKVCRAKFPKYKVTEKFFAMQAKNSHKKKPTEAKKGNLLTPPTSGGNGNPWSRRYVEGGGRIPVVSSRRESLTGVVTFSDPKELRQALVEMDHHMVSTEMSAPEGGLASLVQHVLHVKLTEVENEASEKNEMEVGVRGGVYNVSNVDGVPKISPKSQSATSVKPSQKEGEDRLICQLVCRLLPYPEIATATNREGETALAFLVNNSRWIKLSVSQKQRLTKYGSMLFGQDVAFPVKREQATQQDVSRSPQEGDIMTEINITGVSDTTMLETNLLAQLDDISSSFRSIVDTLQALERRCQLPEQPQEQTQNPQTGDEKDKEKLPGNESTSGENETPMDVASENAAESIDLIGFPPSTSVVPDDLPGESLPVLIQLIQSWPSVVSTVLGYYPFGTSSVHSDVHMTKEPRGSGDLPRKGPSRCSPVDSCIMDVFVFELLSHSDEAVLMTFVEMIVDEMNKHSQNLTLDAVHRIAQLQGDPSAADVAMMVGMKFLRSVIRQLAVHLSRSGLSYVDLRTRLGSSPSTSTSRSSQGDNVQFKKKVRMILRSFSWLAVHELTQAAEASVLPVREGVAKPQARSTGSSVSNNVPNPNGFPGARFRFRPGIRVGPHDLSARPQDPPLRTAQRISQTNITENSSACRGIRLADISEGPSGIANKKHAPSPLRASPFEVSRVHGKKNSLVDSDSDSADETDHVGALSGDGDSDMELDERDQRSVSVTTGITHDHPYAWALDGRVASLIEGNNLPGHIHIPQWAAPVVSPPSVHTGNCYLTRMFSRLVKETLVLMTTLTKDTYSTQQGSAMLPSLTITQQERQSVQNHVMSVLERSWLWLAGVLDVVEGQLRMGKDFDTKRYLASLRRPEDAEQALLGRSMSTIPGASPEEYLMFLLRAHNNEHKDSLPVVDMLCYEHTVYVLDAFIYSMTHWPRLASTLDRRISMTSNDGDDSSPSFSQPSQPEDGPLGLETKSSPNTESKRWRRHSHEREAIIKFFGMDVMHGDREKFLTSLQDTIQQKFPKVPKASWEVFAHNVTLARQKSEDPNLTSQKESEEESGLPTTFSAMGSHTYPSPLVTNWSPDQVISRWKISVDLFSRLFLADGPGAERESFLAARAGVAGRLARFRRAASYLRESISSESQQMGSYGGLGARVSTTLTLTIKRQKIQENTLRILGEMSTCHYSNLRVKFEGEEGSGPGVNRGFFAAMANALKTDEKLPVETTTLLHEPGKLPEQSGFYAPKPFAYSDKSPEENNIKNRRLKMFTAIGRFIGLSLWFSVTVPLNFSRHVVKFLLERDVTWEDLAFFNADLFEGLSSMILDTTHPLMTSERFQATYCCHFETSVGGTTEELIPGGSQIPVTPDNIFKYVRLYATKVMIGCVENELRAMRSGLNDVIPSELLTSLTPEDFQLLLSGGTTDVDINRLRSVMTFSNSNGCSTDILDRFKRWFWSIVQKMTPLQRQQLLYFCTGSAVLPAPSDRRDPEQELNITVDVISGNTKALPMATTCGQRMSIPLYPSKKILKRKLFQAIQCQGYGLG